MKKFYIIVFTLMLIASVAINAIFLPTKLSIITNAEVESNTIIIDAGHGGLTNTID